MNRFFKGGCLVGIAVLLGVAPAFADDFCDDYLGRHYRRDLKTESVKIRSEVRDGAPVQRVTLNLKNWGERPVEGGKEITVEINGKTAMGRLPSVVPSLSSAEVPVFYPAGSFLPCTQLTVKIDTTRTAGQWGCAVYTNDTTTISPCVRVPLLRPLPIQLPRPFSIEPR